MAKKKEKVLKTAKIKKTLLSAILNLVDAVVCIALAVLFFVLLKTGVIGQAISGANATAFAVVLLLAFPLTIICFVPIGLHAIYKIIFCIHLFKAYVKAWKGEEFKFKNWMYGASFVLRIVTAIFMFFEILLTTSLCKAGGAIAIGVIYGIIIGAMIALQIFVIFIESKSKQERLCIK